MDDETQISAMKDDYEEVSGLPTSLKQERRAASSPVTMGESSSSGTSRLETDSFKGI
uniref:Uncharacterized protein n=1 Tax=Solanum tuberosum TaxID=4113 RepID=M1C249_SOLTU